MFRRLHVPFRRTLPDPQSSNPPSDISGPIHEDGVDSKADANLSRPKAISNTVQSQEHREAEAGPLGLTVVYTPENARTADIVFIHGLGGTSHWTWSKNRDPELFWPLKFLPLEPDVGSARILTFGYNANFLRAGSVITSVLDFAKDLLFDLKYAKDDQKDDLGMGSVPLIFVAHSMGGLIVKEAYIQGQIDPEYQSIVKAISAVIFLATPHRGTHLAETLNRILQSTMITKSKQYISELAKNSLTLQKLNEQFRHIAPRLDIVSFYETRPTSIAFKSIMVLEKDSSILGYPGEASKALDADHHGVCKYESTSDPNYIAVRNVLMSLLRKIVSTTDSKEPPPSNRRELHDLKSLLAITEAPAIDYSFFRDQWTPETCEWVLQDENFIKWLQTPDTMSSLLWLNGRAASGKSVLSSFIINNLAERGFRCQYFFIRFGDQKKQALSPLLRSIAYQVAQTIPSFSQKLFEHLDEAIDYETAGSRTIWERIFRSILFTLEERTPLYWLIDGLDEAHEPRAIMKLLSDVSHSAIPLRILFVSRKSSEIEFVFQKVPSALNPRTISVEGHLEDLQCYVWQELSMPGSSDFKEDIVKRVVERSQNNFLWVRHAVSKLNLCHSLADIEAALRELPVGMEALYDRMASSIVQNQSPTNMSLALNILQYVTCSLRELTVTELFQALSKDRSDFLDLERSIVDMCGGFVVIDNGGNVTMIHHTAHEYLLSDNKHPFYVDRSSSHKSMFLSCMKSLMATGLRVEVSRNREPEFVSYASSWWSSHLALTSPNCAQIDEVLKKFLTNHWVLTWIHILAVNNQQRILIQASENLSKYRLKRQRYDSQRKEKGRNIVEQELLESWSTDFVKLVGKFSASLRRNPESIYRLIPPFCPQNSSIYRIFGKPEAKSIAVSGISTDNWDDLLARIPLGSSSYASSITACGALVGILTRPGSVSLYDASTFEEATVSPIQHGENVYRMELNNTATLLATYGYRTTKIWETSTGKCKVSVDNIESRPRPLSILFTRNNNTLIVGNEDRRIRSLDLSQQSPTWELVAELEEPELEGHFLNSSSYMALNREGTLAAVAYRGYPLSAWEIDGPVHIGHCWRARDEFARGEVIGAVWHPHSPEVLGLYIGGILFKWHPYEGKIVEVPIRASRLAISRDGNLLVTGDALGAVEVHTTSDLRLLYQLTSQDVALGLTFSPDHRRFYDIRGYYANAWEPNALMKFAEQTDKYIESGSETESFTHSVSTYSSPPRRVSTITVLAASPSGRFHSYGTEIGTVHLVDAHKEKSIGTHKGFLSIEQMSWSDNGKHVCFSDTGKRIFIISVDLDPSTSEPVVNTAAEVPMKNITKGPITHLLFQPDSSQLLVFTSKTIHTISLASYSVSNSVELDTAESRWIAHPQDPKLIIGFGPQRALVLDSSLQETQAYTINLESPLDRTTVDKVLVTQDKKHLLIQVSSQNNNSREKTFYYFETSKFSISQKEAPSAEQKGETVGVTPITLFRDVSAVIALPMSFNPHGCLVFLSRDFSICSWQLSSGITSTINPNHNMATTSSSLPLNHHQPKTVAQKPFKELFPLPGDWISRDCLYLCAVWGVEKSFLCPRNGEVAVVRCAALA